MGGGGGGLSRESPIESLLVAGESSPRAALTKHHTLGASNHRNLFSLRLESKIRVLAGLVPSGVCEENLQVVPRPS